MLRISSNFLVSIVAFALCYFGGLLVDGPFSLFLGFCAFKSQSNAKVVVVKLLTFRSNTSSFSICCPCFLPYDVEIDLKAFDCLELSKEHGLVLRRPLC